VKTDLDRGVKSGNRNTSGKAEVIQERDFSGLNHGGISSGGKKRLDSGYHWNIKLL
jgi:hypothetical protein